MIPISAQGASNSARVQTPAAMKPRKPKKPKEAPKSRTPTAKRGRQTKPTRGFEKRIRREGVAAAESNTQTNSLK